jgi:pentatricopeptide repeat protein
VQGQGLNVDLDRIRALIETDDFDAALTLLEEMIRKERLS